MAKSIHFWVAESKFFQQGILYRKSESFISKVLKDNPDWSLISTKNYFEILYFIQSSHMDFAFYSIICSRLFSQKSNILHSMPVKFLPGFFFFCQTCESKIYPDVVICNILIVCLFIMWFSPQNLSARGAGKTHRVQSSDWHLLGCWTNTCWKNNLTSCGFVCLWCRNTHKSYTLWDAGV